MNSEKLTEFIAKLKKDKKTALIIFTAILGMLLILFSGTPAEKNEKALTPIEVTPSGMFMELKLSQQ